MGSTPGHGTVSSLESGYCTGYASAPELATRGRILKGTRFFRLGSSFADLHMKLIELSSFLIYGDPIGALARRVCDHSDSHAHATLTTNVPSARSSHACHCMQRIPRGSQRSKSTNRAKKPILSENVKDSILATCESMPEVSTRVWWWDMRAFYAHLVALVAMVCVFGVEARAPKSALCFLHQITHINQRGGSVQATDAQRARLRHSTTGRLTECKRRA